MFFAKDRSGLVQVPVSPQDPLPVSAMASGTFEASAVSTAADPSYTEGTVNPLSANLAGYLRVVTNAAKINGTTLLAGAGATGAGSQRVTVAQDTTTIAGSAPGTAGTASANVVTIQGIASMTKLLVTPDSVALPANQSVNLSQVAGATTATSASGVQKVGLVGNAGATLDAALAAGTAPTNGVAIIGQFNTTPPTLTNTQTGSIQLSAKSNLLSQIMDAAGNNRGANVNALNGLSISIDQINGAAVDTATTGMMQVGIKGGGAAILDATLAAGTAPPNGLAVIGQFNTTPPTLTNTQTGALQLSAKSNLLSQIMDAAGNNRGANVDSTNNLAAAPPTTNITGADALANNFNLITGLGQTAIVGYSVTFGFNGTTWDRTRTATIGNNVAATGIAASDGYGQYLSNANQPAATTGNYSSLQLTPDGALRTAPQRPATGDILVGYQTFTSTTGATTLITVPAGRTWVGTISASCSCAEVAAGTAQPQARAVFATAGTNVTPAAGTFWAVDARSGANAVSGTVGSGGCNASSTPFTITAPAGNSVTITVASTNVGTASVVDASAIGNLQ